MLLFTYQLVSLVKVSIHVGDFEILFFYFSSSLSSFIHLLLPRSIPPSSPSQVAMAVPQEARHDCISKETC